MRRVPRSMAVAAVSALALVASACGGGGDDEEPTGEGGGSIVVRGCNPENPLIPPNTAETCGGDVLDVTVARLVHYDSETAEPENDIAESIETTDNQNFTIAIKPGYMFSDGTEVLAKNFVDAWNYAAYGPNGYQANYFFEPIEGYADAQCTGEGEDPCAGAGAPAAETMSGLQVVDDHTFTVRTSSKVSNLPVRLGYTAFAPLPDSFFADPEAFGRLPASAGPYMVEEWAEGQQINLVRNPEYSGEFDGNVDEIQFKIYTDPNAAYADLTAGNLDVLDEIPTDVLVGDQWLSDLEDRGTSREVGVIGYVGINPDVDPSLANPDLRKAISMAIDRQTIIDEIYAGQRTPATGWVSPVVDGYQENQCGEWCTFDPEAAKALFDQAGGYDGTLTLHYNGDGDHGPWTEATCNSIRQTLGVDCVTRPTVDFATFLTNLEERTVRGMFRLGWQMDYPSIENFLVPTFGPGAASNYYDYNDPEFADLTEQAAAADSLEEANELYQQAEALLAEDMRIIPMWHYVINAGWSPNVDNVTINAFGQPDLTQVTVN
jgi:oligopeptide transport system substrate-binding protein